MIIRLLADPHESNGKRHTEPRAFDTLSCNKQNQFSSATSQFAAPLDLFATPQNRFYVRALRCMFDRSNLLSN